jgi:hypothetical protein
MVARRLLIVMLVMLVIASLSSVFLAEPGRRTGAGSPQTTTGEHPTGPPERRAEGKGRLVRVTLESSASRPQTIRLRTGDQLALRVDARRTAQVALVGLGQLEDVVPLGPARFNLYADREGRFPVRMLPVKRTIGVIVVAEEGNRGRGAKGR